MTMLASWVGIDTHGITSAYIVSDSRFSMGNKHFDHGRKTFASYRYPEILGYAGDVLFASTILGQITEMIDCNLLFDSSTTCFDKNKIIFDKISYEFNNYSELGMNDFKILHITRETIVSGYPHFYGFVLEWNNRSGWKRHILDIPKSSDIILVIGSGKREFLQNYLGRYQKGSNKHTSRNVFHCFCDTLFTTSINSVGGAPQLVGIIRKPNSSAQYYGIICNNKRYFMGSEVPKNSNYINIEWRNDLFELCNGINGHKYETAASQPDYLRIN